MAFEAYAITGQIGLDERPQVNAINNAKKAAQDYKRTMEDAAHGASSSWENSLHNVKANLGKRSAFGESVELLAGAGVIGGLGLAANEIKNFADEVKNLNIEFQDGSISAGEYGVGIAKSIPIIGKFFEVGQSIRDVFTGESVAAKKAADAIEFANKQAQQHGKYLQEIKNKSREALKEWRDSMDEIANKVELLRSSPDMKGVIQERQASIADIKKYYEEYLKAANAQKADGTDGDFVTKNLEYNAALARQADLHEKLTQAIKTQAQAEAQREAGSAFRLNNLANLNRANSELAAAQEASDRQDIITSGLGGDVHALQTLHDQALDRYHQQVNAASPLIDAGLSAQRAQEQSQAFVKGGEALAKSFNNGLGGILLRAAQATAEGVVQKMSTWEANHKAAAAIANSVMTPAEKFSDALRDLNYLRDQGALDPTTYHRAAAEAFQNAKNDLHLVQLPRPGIDANGDLDDSFRGGHRVNSGDVPQAFIDLNNTASDSLEQLQSIRKTLEQTSAKPGDQPITVNF